MFGLPLTEQEAEVFRELTGRTTIPTTQSQDVTIVCGRRGAKTRIVATMGCVLATYRDYKPFLGPGEIAIVALVAVSRDQARSLLNYAKGLFEAIPALQGEVTRITETSIELGRRRVAIEITTGSFRTIRGRTLIACALDECAFLRSEESANPDFELVAAAKPGLRTIPGSMLIKLSSPYAKTGVLWEDFKKHYGVDNSPTLVIQAATWQLNPTITRESLQAEYDADQAKAGSEWGALFRSDIESFISRETVEKCVVQDAFERPRVFGRTHMAFVDAASGSGRDSYVLAISHLEKDIAILDHLTEVRPPFAPEEVIDKFCKILRAYAISKVEGDRYGQGFQPEQFRKRNVSYEPSKLNRSEIYLGLLPYLNSGKIELLDNKRLVDQLSNLVRRSSSSGRDIVDHDIHNSDDCANATAGSLLMCLGKQDVLKRFQAYGRLAELYAGMQDKPWANRGVHYL